MRKLIFLLFLLIPVNVWATTTEFEVSKAATIFSASTNQHATSEAYMNYKTSSGEQVIWYWDLSSIPTDSTVTSGTIAFFGSEANCTTETLQIHAIEDPDASGAWDELGSSGDVFNNHATWAYKDHDAVTDWDSGNSNNFADVDDNAVADSVAISACAGFGEYVFTDVTSMVASWVSSPSTNAGAFISCADASCTIDTRGKYHSTASERPHLTVTYTAGGGGGGGNGKRLIITQ